MSVRKLKPITPGQRFRIVNNFEEITTNKPEKSLTVGLSKKGGRNNTGKMTMRYTGGGHKKKYRIIDFKRNKANVEATVKSVEYDPNRTANIALLHYTDGIKAYILAPKGLKVGDVVESGDSVDIKPGNALELKNIPTGTSIHNIELKPGKGGQLVRSAGASAQVLGADGDYTLVRLQSGEVRKILSSCRATIGTVGNEQHSLIQLGKAGRKRWLGKRPQSRGSVMNPNDHPHGGGEGRAPIGRPSPMSPWGKPTLGKKTRRGKKSSDKLIVRGRKRK